MILLDGKKAAESLQATIKETIDPKAPPCIVMVLVGEHPPSLAYVSMKQKTAGLIGMRSQVVRLPEKVSFEQLTTEIRQLNENPEVHGILIQMPLPAHLDTNKVLLTLSPKKDVDGLHPMNAGLLATGQKGFIPCTPLGIKILLDFYKIPYNAQHVVVLGRSNLVGRPLMTLLSQKSLGGNATVTLANSQSRHLEEICRSADILVAAIGIPHFVKASFVKEGTTVVDVGITRVEGKLLGDVDFDAVKNKCHAISPVPGGVGPMTIACLLSNTLEAKLLNTK